MGFVRLGLRHRIYSPLEIPQATIQESIVALNNDEDWGNPREYNIKITKTGEKMETEYTVIPARPQPLSAQIAQAVAEKPVELLALYFNANPTSKDWKVEARQNIYDRLSVLYQDASARGVQLNALDLENAQLSEILKHFEECLMLVSTGKTVQEPIPEF